MRRGAERIADGDARAAVSAWRGDRANAARRYRASSTLANNSPTPDFARRSWACARRTRRWRPGHGGAPLHLRLISRMQARSNCARARVRSAVASSLSAPCSGRPRWRVPRLQISALTSASLGIAPRHQDERLTGRTPSRSRRRGERGSSGSALKLPGLQPSVSSASAFSPPGGFSFGPWP